MLSNIVTQNLNFPEKAKNSNITELEFNDIDDAYHQAEMLTSIGYEVSINHFDDGAVVVSIESTN